jgi:hypothetical protein
LRRLVAWQDSLPFCGSGKLTPSAVPRSSSLPSTTDRHAGDLRAHGGELQVNTAEPSGATPISVFPAGSGGRGKLQRFRAVAAMRNKV